MEIKNLLRDPHSSSAAAGPLHPQLQSRHTVDPDDGGFLTLGAWARRPHLHALPGAPSWETLQWREPGGGSDGGARHHPLLLQVD